MSRSAFSVTLRFISIVDAHRYGLKESVLDFDDLTS
jgi:hypothetical protein